MTGTDTTDIHDKKPVPNPRSTNPSRAPPRNTGWIHDYFRSPVADKVAHKQTRIERQDGLMFATGHSKE